MLILAIDLGKFNSMACIYDTVTHKHSFQTIATTPASVKPLLKSRKFDLVVMEACGPSGWISDLCHQEKLETLVCSTNDEAWQWKNVKRKTDRDDALKLARMAMMRQLTPTHVPAPETREHRRLVKHRKTLCERINRIKNSIRSLFANHAISIATGARAWHTGRELIDGYRKPLAQCQAHELWQGELDIELTQLDDTTKLYDSVDTRLDEIAKLDPRIKRVMTIPGVGRITAEALVTAIDDPHRFKSGRELSAYLGLVPKQYQSGQTDRNGRISKRGPRLVRTILVECAWCSLRYNEWAKAVYERVHGGQSTRKKKAAVALARKIAVVAWAMLRHETDWSIETMNSTAEKLDPKKRLAAKLEANVMKQNAAPAQTETVPDKPVKVKPVKSAKATAKPKPKPKPKTTRSPAKRQAAQALPMDPRKPDKAIAKPAKCRTKTEARGGFKITL